MKKFFKMAILLVVVLGLGVGGYFGYHYFFQKEISLPGVSTGIAISIPQKILDNKFGFLSGGPEDAKMIKGSGALWVRPHPGPFLWDSMQKNKTSPISFAKTDEIIKKFQEENVGILATLWPFANWDQKARSDAVNCQVSSQDEFLPRNNLKGRPDYLPEYRCSPNDWNAYSAWVQAVVERYDGDGSDDMPNLKVPIKYWEVMNEPDLEGPEGEDSRLDFYKQGPQEYAKLLVKTAAAIREEDPEAKVLIAGAAGGNEYFLNFYREVFQNPQTPQAFDIANVHCISNDDFDSFNVEPYKKLLTESGIQKPIWVTEAEAMISDDADVNASQTLASTKKALELGAERIFFTRYEFERGFFGKEEKAPLPSDQPRDFEEKLSGKDPVKAYQVITSQ